jgi:hypothetical protein
LDDAKIHDGVEEVVEIGDRALLADKGGLVGLGEDSIRTVLEITSKTVFRLRSLLR